MARLQRSEPLQNIYRKIILFFPWIFRNLVWKNLTHNQQSYAFIENVITDKNCRKRGLATQCLNFAKEIALKERCYKMMLLTGSKKESTLNFYRKAGYNSKDKTAFIQWI